MKTKSEIKFILATQELSDGRTEPQGDFSARLDYGNALNWYNTHNTIDKSVPWILQYMKLNGYSLEDIEIAKKISSSEYPMTMAAIARMLTNGCILNASAEKYLKDKLITILHPAKNIVVTKKENEIVIKKDNVQDRIYAQAYEYIGEIEGSVDDYNEKGKTNLNVYDFLSQKQTSPQVVSYIEKYYLNSFIEMFDAHEKVDEEAVFNYSFLDDKQLIKRMAFIKSIADDCYRYSHNVKAIRKPRKARKKIASKVVAKLQYQKDDTELNLVSINPEKIVGADQVWIYNTKYKVLSVFNKNSTEGLTVKGTTIKNFDKNSQCKTLRKPAEAIDKVMKAGKVELRKLMDSFKTKGKVPTGRINDATIILRVI